MKIRHLIMAALAVIVTLVACEPAEDLGLPSIKIDGNAEITFEAAGGDQRINITATRNWAADFDADWIRVSPDAGEASATSQTITITVKQNPGMDRSAQIKFSIDMSYKTVTVTQKGPGGSADALIVYSNDFDKKEAVKGSSWTTYLDSFQGWHNEKGTGIASVTYGFQKITARTNSAGGSGGKHSLYTELGASGVNYLWLGTAPTHFAVKNITLPEGKTDYTLSFGTERYEYSETETVDNTFNWSEFKVYVSTDSQKWVKLSCDFAGGSLPVGKWDLASSTFTVPAGTQKLHVYFTSTKGSAYAIDDVKLVQSASAGTALDFDSGEAFEVPDSNTSSGDNGGNTENVPEGTGEGTLASPYSAAKAWHLASALGADDTKPGVYVQGIVKEIKEVSTDYGNATYYITDADGIAKFYVFRGKYLNSAKFTSADQIKVGDNVLIYGDLMNYKGDSPQLGQDNFLVKLNDAEGSAPSQPESKGEKTVAGFIEAADDANFYTLAGTVSNFNSQYCSFDLTDESGSIYVYSVNSASKSQWKGVIGNGSEVTLIGKYMWYENAEDASKNKHEVTEAWIVSCTQGEVEVESDGSFPDAAWSYSFKRDDLGKEGAPSASVTLNGKAWSFNMVGSTYLGFDSSKGRGLQMGKGAEAASSITLSTEGITGTIKKIIVNTSGASNTDATLVVKVGGQAFGSSVNTTTSATDYTFEGSASGAIELNWTLTTAAVYIKHIAVYTE